MFVSKERTKLTAVVTALRVDRVALCATRSLLSLWGHCSRAGRSEHNAGPRRPCPAPRECGAPLARLSAPRAHGCRHVCVHLGLCGHTRKST